MQGIQANSASIVNLCIFIVYLFIAVFILLSMFFAILGESQANVRDDLRAQQNESREGGQAAVPEYGIFTRASVLAGRLASRLPFAGDHVKARLTEEKVKEMKEAMEANGPTAVDRVEARQLEMLETLQEVCGRVWFHGWTTPMRIARAPLRVRVRSPSTKASLLPAALRCSLMRPWP